MAASGLLIVSALGESLVGLTLLLSPSLVARLLLGASLDEPDDRVRAAKLAALGERVRLGEFDERAIELRVIKEEPR